jgi:hypothetical protein
MAKKKEEVENVEKVDVKKSKPDAPKIYEDGPINMASEMITTEKAFLELFKGTTVARAVKLPAAYKKAKKWREKYK